MTVNRGVLETSRPPVSVRDFSLKDIASFLKKVLSKHENVREAYLFGSLAENRQDDWSDIDVVIVADVTAPFIERPREFFDLYDLGIPVDILVYTPKEFEDLKNSESGFWRSFRENHLRIF